MLALFRFKAYADTYVMKFGPVDEINLQKGRNTLEKAENVCNIIIPLQNKCFWRYTGISLSVSPCVLPSVYPSVNKILVSWRF